MPDRTVRDEDTDRVAEAVRHALRLVGPAERGIDHASEDASSEAPAA